MTFRIADSQITGDPVCEAGSKDGEEGGCHALAAPLAGLSDPRKCDLSFSSAIVA